MGFDVRVQTSFRLKSQSLWRTFSEDLLSLTFLEHLLCTSHDSKSSQLKLLTRRLETQLHVSFTGDRPVPESHGREPTELDFSMGELCKVFLSCTVFHDSVHVVKSVIYFLTFLE